MICPELLNPAPVVAPGTALQPRGADSGRAARGGFSMKGIND
jgi:hypothetical protein